MRLKNSFVVLLGFIWACTVFSNGEIKNYQQNKLRKIASELGSFPFSWVYKVSDNDEHYDFNGRPLGKGMQGISDAIDASNEYLAYDLFYRSWYFSERLAKGLVQQTIICKESVDNAWWNFWDQEGSGISIKTGGATFINENGEIYGGRRGEWVLYLHVYCAEIENQKRFAENRENVIKDGAVKLITSNSIRSRYGWEKDGWITLQYDDVSEEVALTDDDVIAGINHIKNVEDICALNLSGCESQVCIDTLIDVLKYLDKVWILNVANCNLTVQTARQLLEVVRNNNHLQVINVSGNDLPDDIVADFQEIVERNRITLSNDLTNHVAISSAILRAIAMDLTVDDHTVGLIAQHPNCDSTLLRDIVVERSLIANTTISNVESGFEALTGSAHRSEVLNTAYFDSTLR